MMKQIQRVAVLSILILAILPAQSLVGATATAVAAPNYSESATSIQGLVDSLRSQVRLEDIRFRQSEESLAIMKQRVDQGLEPASNLAQAQSMVEVNRTALMQAISALQEAERLAALVRPVDADVNDASISQIAEVLSKVASVKIAVDPGVPNDKGVSLRVKATPLGKVLETVAVAMNLMIAPGTDGSIVLTRPSTMTIDGTTVEPRSPSYPWSAEWPYSGDPGAPQGDKWLGLIRAALPRTSVAPVAAPYQLGACSTPQPVITSMSPSTFIVGEPGTNDKGEPGMWLTFYSIDSGRMIPGIKYFHVFTVPKETKASK